MKDNLGTRIYKNVKNDILVGTYPSNTFLTEGEIAEKYQVSKAPVRTAFRMLCDDGYLISYARKGYLVSNTSEADFCRLQQLRYAIESLNAIYIIKFVSDDKIESLRAIATLEKPSVSKYSTVNAQFHIAMAELTENKYTVQALDNLFVQLEMLYPYISTKNLPVEDQECHNPLLDAMLERNVESTLEWLKKDIEEKTFDERLSIVQICKIP